MPEIPPVTNIDLIIAKRLKERREMLGMSQKELSKSAKISEKQVQKYENATIAITGTVIYFFAKALKVPREYFLDIPHVKPPNEYFFTTEDDYKFLQYIIAEDPAEYVVPPKIDNRVNSGEVGARSDGAKPIGNRRVTSNGVTNSSIDNNTVAAPMVSGKELANNTARPQASSSNAEEKLGLVSCSQLTAEIEAAMQVKMCDELHQEVLALVKVFIEVPNPVIRQKIIELLKAITTVPL